MAKVKLLHFVPALVVILALSGCISGTMAGLIGQRKEGDEQANAPMQREHDPVNPVRKPEVGIDYDPRDWNADRYVPGRIDRVISSPGFKGMTQQTFAETGGVGNVHLSTDGSRMVYSSTRYSTNPEICVQGITARAVQLITEDRMGDMMPKFSPDGKEIAWASNRYGNWDILVQEVNAGPDSRPRQLTRSTDDDVHPTWSPDGQLMAFSRFNSMDGLWQVWVMNYNTRTLSYITEGLFPEFKPIASRRGDSGDPVYTLAYQRARKRDVPWYSIWTIDVQMGRHGAVEAVASPKEIVSSDSWAAINPCWSPKGDYISFATVRKSTLAQWQSRIYKADDVWVIRVDGTDLTQITSHSAPDWDPWWSVDPSDPDGPGRLYFTSERSGVANIWSVKPIVPGMVAESMITPGSMRGPAPVRSMAPPAPAEGN